jgi:hypothetical protein
LHVEEEEDGKCELVGNFSDHEQLANLEKLILEKKYGITPPSSDTTAVEVGVNEETDVEKLDNSTNLPVIPNAARKAPSHGECELYKWVQDEDWMNVTIPLPRPAIRDDVLLFVAPDSLDVKVKTCPELGVISGRLSGNMTPSSTQFELTNNPGGELSGELDSKLDIRVMKKPQNEATYEMWFGLFAHESPSPTACFGREVFPTLAQSGYKWHQTKKFFTITLELPEEHISKSDVNLNLSSNCRDWSCEVKLNNGGTLYIGGRFFGRINLEDSLWFIDTKGDDEIGYKKQLVIEISKQFMKQSKEFERAWWPRLCE